MEFSPYLDDSREFSFCILENLTLPNCSRIYQSSRDIALFISGYDRPMILKILVSGIGQLLRCESQLNIYRITADSYPPEPALEKHQHIGEAFRQHGYNLWRCDTHRGQRAWIMTRLTLPLGNATAGPHISWCGAKGEKGYDLLFGHQNR
jgi:hypothetical protein